MINPSFSSPIRSVCVSDQLAIVVTDPAAVQEISWNVYSRRFTRPWNFSDTPCIDFWQGPTLLNRWLFASWRSKSPYTCKRRRLDSFLFLWQRCVCQPEGLQSDVKRSIPRMDIASLRQCETPTRSPETHRTPIRPSRFAISSCWRRYDFRLDRTLVLPAKNRHLKRVSVSISRSSCLSIEDSISFMRDEFSIFHYP